jgi:hypothetical protein
MSQASNRAIWILGGALVVALMVIAFLLGRGSSSDRIERASAPEVAAYFAKIDSIQAGPVGISAEAFAQRIVGESAEGRAEGFDQLQTDLDRIESELRAVTPPAACKEFHDLTLSAASDAQRLMIDLRRAFAGDVANATELAGRAQAAQEKTKRIEAMRKALEAEYGLVH